MTRLAGALLLGMVLGPSVACAVVQGPTARIGPEVAAIRRTASYDADVRAPGRTVSIEVDRREESVELGGRLEAGWTWVLRRRQVGLFPHLSFSYVPLREVETHFASGFDQYSATVHPSWWSVGGGCEVQLMGRRLLFSGEVGVAHAGLDGTLRGSGFSGPMSSGWGAPWGRLAFGGRWPASSLVNGGAMLGGEIAGPLFGAEAALLGVLTLFVELDGSQW